MPEGVHCAPILLKENAMPFAEPRAAIFLSAALFVFADTAHAAVEISKKPTQNVACSAGICTATANEAVLNVSDLTSLLASGNVTVASGSLAQDIRIDTALSWTSENRLTLDAYRSIAFNKPVVVAGNGKLTITTESGGETGDFRFFGKGHVEFWNPTGGLIINGAHYTLVSSVRQLANKIRNRGDGLFALAKSVDLTGQTYTQSPIPGFDGILEGLGNTISNLTINASSDSVGFFGQFAIKTTSSAIRDVGLLSVGISSTRGSQGVGALVGELSGAKVLNSYATGQVSGSGIVGGLVGYNESAIIRNSYANVAVSGNGVVGGLVGKNERGCTDCLGTIEVSYAIGIVSGGDDTEAGGLVGQNHGGIISDSYAMGAAGGGNNAFVGGLLGNNNDWSEQRTDAEISASFATGAVTGGSGAMVGGLIGQDLAKKSITDSYWDLDTSGISDPSQGAGNIANDPGITGLTTEQFKSGLPVGFGASIWKEKVPINTGYPYLIDNPPS